MKFIGTSFSRCLFSLARDEVHIDNVIFVLTNTAYPSRDVMLEQVRATMQSKALDTHLANAALLWDTGRIYQPSARPGAHKAHSEACWVAAPDNLVPPAEQVPAS